MIKIIIYIFLWMTLSCHAQTNALLLLPKVEADSSTTPPAHNYVYNFGSGLPTNLTLFNCSNSDGDGVTLLTSSTFDAQIRISLPDNPIPADVRYMRMRVFLPSSIEWDGDIYYTDNDCSTARSNAGSDLASPTVGVWEILLFDNYGFASFSGEPFICTWRIDWLSGIAGAGRELYVDWITLHSE
jgi:hypothetical protein